MSGFVLYVLGVSYISVALVLLGFAGLALLWGEDPRGFALAAGVGLALGGVLRARGTPKAEPRRAEGLFTVGVLWILVPLLGAIPYWVSGHLNFLDALFESVSGFTTTGATILDDFGKFNKSLFLWRGLTQWFGGIGIIVLFIAVLPHFAVAGRQLFFAEATGVQKDKLTPRLRHTAEAVLRVYLLLTALAVLGYALAGMPLYDALANALATVPAGGFSPSPTSFAAYPAAAQWVAVLFMYFAGANFLLMYKLIFGREIRPLLKDPEFKVYTLVVLAASAGFGFYHFVHHDYDLEASFRHSFFQATSILTSTGFASVDYETWVVPAQIILFFLMFISGSAGSAAGGPKLIRWLVVFAHMSRELRRTLHPNAVLPLRTGGKTVGEEVLRSVFAFMAFYFLLFGLGVLLITTAEGDFIVGFTASAAAIGNVGPGLGSVGPMGSYAALAPVSKLVMIFQMWAGRIELIPVLLLFNPETWRAVRRGR
ncbi:TrkH family potassium uptake protein [Marinithermus hydrothermalis]|uniref:Cation transporter n=1 Tax=Marinithermus hydrothermalis (strain DSM 14884 / JCM 11576 / T1) TaxID=869210 RepID=F2NKV5_MARHT|nr:TrkH family potassium uptake protein [Marinithermus hydrothermalis]AEB11144.1 cation transporter [Marinithermus hydrothermalis DSM 14884]